MGIKVKTGKFRASYVWVFKPKTVTRDDGTTKEQYSVMALFDVDADLSALKNAALKAIEEKFGADKAQAIIKHPKFKSPFKDQATMVDDQGELRPGMKPGAIFVNLNADLKPLVLAPNVSEITDPRDFYSGCYAVASCEAYAWEHAKNGRGVSIGLLGIQKVADGDPLGGTGLRADVADFEAVADASGAKGGTTAASVFD